MHYTGALTYVSDIQVTQRTGSIRSLRMAALNLRGAPPGSEEPPRTLPEEPLGLDLIRRWLAKPRPRLYALWLWVPYLAEGTQKGYGWLRKNAGPALRRTAETLRKAAKITEALREAAERLRARLDRTFPPGSRGRAVATHLADGSRLLLRSVLLLVGIGREADRLPRVWERDHVRDERPPKPEKPPAGTGPGPVPETPPRPVPDEPGASAGSGPTGGSEPDASAGPEGHRDPAPSSDPARPPTHEVSRPEPSRSEPSQQEPPPPEPPREDPPDRDSAEPPPAAPSPVPGLSPGPRADALAKLSKTLRGQILRLGKRPRKAVLRYTVWRILNECGERTSEDLGLLLQMDPANLAKRHLSPLVDQRVLERTIPDQITHPEQAYRSTGPPPGAHGLPPVGE